MPAVSVHVRTIFCHHPEMSVSHAFSRMLSIGTHTSTIHLACCLGDARIVEGKKVQLRRDPSRLYFFFFFDDVDVLRIRSW